MGGLGDLNLALKFIWIMVLIVFLIPVYLLPIMLIGPLLAPFAAATCFIIARSRGMRPMRYAVVGALYSTLFFLPFCYLVARMYNRSVPSGYIRVGYVYIYLVWLFGSVLYNLFLMFAYHPGRHHILDFTNVWVLTAYLIIIVICVNLIALSISITKLENSHRNYLEHTSCVSSSVLPRKAYIMPFVYTFVSLLLTVVLLLFLRLLEVLAPRGSGP